MTLTLSTILRLTKSRLSVACLQSAEIAGEVSEKRDGMEITVSCTRKFPEVWRFNLEESGLAFS